MNTIEMKAGRRRIIARSSDKLKKFMRLWGKTRRVLSRLRTTRVRKRLKTGKNSPMLVQPSLKTRLKKMPSLMTC